MELPDLPVASEIDRDVKNICIVGAGAGGLVSLKIFMETPQYKSGKWKPVVYESRNQIGGIWLPAPPDEDPPWTPLYDSLTTNLPHSTMAFTDFPFPPSTHVYPDASVVEKYLLDYAEEFCLRKHVKLNTTVTSAIWDPSKQKWTVSTSTKHTHDFDLLVVSNGHHRVPRYPDTPGLSKWLDSKKAMHSVYYRRPKNYGSRIVVVGGGPSGLDISSDLQSTSSVAIIFHSTSLPKEGVSNTASLVRKGRLTKLHDDLQTVSFDDGSSESDIDFCIVATGYKVSTPFLSPSLLMPSIPPPVPPLPTDLYNSSYNIFPLAKHLFPLIQTISDSNHASSTSDQTHPPSHTLAFVGLLVRVIPFPLMEAQAKAIAHVLAHHSPDDPLSLDPISERVDLVSRSEELRERFSVPPDDTRTIAKQWHRFEPLQQFDYRDALCAFSDDKTRVVEWEREMYLKKDVLRKVWIDIKESGRADEFVRGVGKGGPHEWVELLRKMLKMAEETGTSVLEVERVKL